MAMARTSAEWAIDWRLFFEIDRKLDPATVGEGRSRVQPSCKLETSLVNPLAFLPEFSQAGSGPLLARDKNGQPNPRAGQISSLARRNLMRGSQHGLPSGQDITRAMGIDPMADRDLKVGKATVENLTLNRPVSEYGESFADAAPLWFYVLAEAQANWVAKASTSTASKAARDALPTHLGPVGGRIVAESFVAILIRDPGSILNAGADWQPRYTSKGRFGMPELIGKAGIV